MNVVAERSCFYIPIFVVGYACSVCAFLHEQQSDLEGHILLMRGNTHNRDNDGEKAETQVGTLHYDDIVGSSLRGKLRGAENGFCSGTKDRQTTIIHERNYC